MSSTSAVPTEPLRLTSSALSRFTAEAQNLEKLHSDNYTAVLRARAHKALADGAMEEIRDATGQQAWLLDITHEGVRMYAIVKRNAVGQDPTTSRADWAVVLVTTGEGHDRNWNTGMWRLPNGVKKSFPGAPGLAPARPRTPKPIRVEDFEPEEVLGPSEAPAHREPTTDETTKAWAALWPPPPAAPAETEERFMLTWDGASGPEHLDCTRTEVAPVLERLHAEGRKPRLFREVPLQVQVKTTFVF